MSTKTILIVDDSELALRLARAALESSGYQVETLVCWEGLDQILNRVTPDLILMDVNMPEILGDFVTTFFKEERRITGIPIVLYSDIDVAELKQRAADSGAEGYISKRWGIEGLVQAIEAFFNAQSQGARA